MADEYLLYHGVLDTLLSGLPDARLYSGSVDVLYEAALTAADLRLYHGVVDALISAPEDVSTPRLYQGVLDVLVSEHQRYAPESISAPPIFLPEYWQGFRPDFIPVGFAIRDAFFEQIINPVTTIEANPYRPDIPNDLSQTDPSLYDYLREQAELIREQHNLTQAGDSTFPWEMAAKSGDKAYTLGSLTRFIHDVCGLIQARYVQFPSDYTDAGHAFIGHDRTSTEWSAAAEPGDTSLWRPIGFTIPYEDDLAGKFGWAIVNGRAPMPIQIESDVQPVAYQRFTWSPESPRFGIFGPGPVVGIVIHASQAREQTDLAGEPYSPRRWLLPEYAWAIDMAGGVTDEYIAGLVTSGTVSLVDEIAALQAAVDSINANQYADAIVAINNSLTILNQKLELESRLRNTTDANLSAKIELLRSVVDALESASGGDFSDILAQIESLQLRLEAFKANINPRVSELEVWRASASATIADLLTAVDADSSRWALEDTGTGASQVVTLPIGGYTVTDVAVYVNGIKWRTTEYTIVDQDLTLTTNAAGDLIEVIGL